MTCPCSKDCSDRSMTCRQTCPEWPKYEAFKREEEERKKEDFLLRDMMSSYRYRGGRRRRHLWAET